MSNVNKETIADIINEKRTTAREIRSKTPNQYGLELAVMLEAEADRIEAALSAPPRNCDRPECVTTKEAQDVWRREDGGKTAYYEWLLQQYEEGESEVEG